MTEQPRHGVVDVVVDVVIRRPLELVASYANDPSNAPHWYAKISSVEWKTEPPVRVGTEVAFVARFLGRELRYTYEVVELTSTSLVMRTAQGPFPMETSYRYAPTVDGDTRMTLRNRGAPSGFARLVRPLLGVAVRRANRQDLRALKARLEA
jgi:hypothetical protein